MILSLAFNLASDPNALGFQFVASPGSRLVVGPAPALDAPYRKPLRISAFGSPESMRSTCPYVNLLFSV
jgi:hypothetical protein